MSRITELPTDERILDVAERLFATRGIGATSIRAIVRDANVNVAAIHYHFGSKQAVLEAVFRRTREPINRERIEALRAVSGATTSAQPDLAEIIRALYWPVFRRYAGASRDRAWRGLAIFAQLRLDPSDEAQAMLEAHESEFVSEFDHAFANAVGRPAESLRRRIQFVNAAAWDVLVQPYFLKELDAADDPAAALHALFEDFVDFAVGAIADSRRSREATRTPLSR